MYKGWVIKVSGYAFVESSFEIDVRAGCGFVPVVFFKVVIERSRVIGGHFLGEWEENSVIGDGGDFLVDFEFKLERVSFSFFDKFSKVEILFKSVKFGNVVCSSCNKIALGTQKSARQVERWKVAGRPDSVSGVCGLGRDDGFIVFVSVDSDALNYVNVVRKCGGSGNLNKELYRDRAGIVGVFICKAYLRKSF